MLPSFKHQLLNLQQDLTGEWKLGQTWQGQVKEIETHSGAEFKGTGIQSRTGPMCGQTRQLR